MALITLANAASRLSAWLQNSPEKAIVKKTALDQYGILFQPKNLPNLSREDFKAFLLYENNKHWEGIHRHPEIYADMDRLRAALTLLLDENQPIETRLDTIRDKNGPVHINGLGRAVLTPILMCVYPDQYAVYNQISRRSFDPA